MASTNDINIEIEWLKCEIVPKLLKERKLIENIADADLENVQIVDIKVDFIGAQEAFMLTKCYRTKIVYDFKGTTNEVNLFVKKTPPLPQDLFDAINFKALFINEILGYEKILPAIADFAKVNFNVAKFYYADLQTNCATVITEDFGSQGWRVAKDRVNLSLEHTLLAVKYLAKFHAAGFALRATNKDAFTELTKGLLESRYASEFEHPQMVLKVKCGTDRCLKVTKEYQKHIPEEFLQKYANLFSDALEYGRKLVKPQEPFVTLCHGDYLRNNVAYKYQDGDNAEPKDVMMFDLQTLRVASPMIDLTTFLGLSNFAEVRHQNFKEIFETYCQQLKKSFEEFAKLPAPEYLSPDSLIKEYIRCLPNVVYISSWFLPDLVEPMLITAAEMLTQEQTDEEIIQDCMTRGGEVMDRELAHQMKELYELVQEHNVDICI
ncbi:uncharacterized protein LOC101895821 [Musca domestica]|uniref:Uncharacterized protein LOC101895821 n=1 Tax=Musca domestica TaxID=7370 RepID=A0A1I8M1M6_MUSDO|nr:uncharacterized protein LOC101895821 [Musca domestica]